MKVFKSILIIISAIIMSLLVPLFGKWYKQKTGIEPNIFYGLCFVGSMIIIIMMCFKIWKDEI